jgi:hypothetical protein
MAEPPFDDGCRRPQQPPEPRWGWTTVHGKWYIAHDGNDTKVRMLVKPSQEPEDADTGRPPFQETDHDAIEASLVTPTGEPGRSRPAQPER